MPGANGTAATEVKPDQLREQGTAIDNERIFAAYADGRVFEPQDVTPRRIDKMLKLDGKAKSIEQALTLPLRGAPWSIEKPAGDSGQTEFVRNALTRPANVDGMSTPIELVIGQATSACLYRRAFFEKVLKVDELGQVVYDKIAFRPAGTCRYLYDKGKGSFKGFSQYVGFEHPDADEEGRVTIEPRKAFVFVYGQHRRPLEGVSDLETPYALWETKQKIRFLWMTFLENQTMPKAIAQDNSDDPVTIQKFAQKVATLKGGGVVGIGQNQAVTPYETSNQAAQTFGDAIRFIDSEMSASVLAGFLDLTGAAASGRGSFALSRDASDLFMQSRQAVLTELGAAIVNWVIADLVRINFGRRAPVPAFKFGPLLPQNAEAAITLLQALAGQQRPIVPPEFINMLVEKVASYMGFDEERVREAIMRQVHAAPADPVAQFHAGVQAATQIVQQQQQAVAV